jgi:hypothetical protein
MFVQASIIGTIEERELVVPADEGRRIGELAMVEGRWSLAAEPAITVALVLVEKTARDANKVFPAAIRFVDRLGRQEEVGGFEIEDRRSRAW